MGSRLDFSRKKVNCGYAETQDIALGITYPSQQVAVPFGNSFPTLVTLWESELPKTPRGHLASALGGGHGML